MDIDIGNALDAVAGPGVPRDSLDRLDGRVAEAHERIDRGMADDEFGYAALNLPERVDTAAIRDAVAPLTDAETVLTIGIGGSALGAATLTDALETDGDAYYLDNVDPAQTSALLADLDLESTALNVVSRSGTTAETLANFLVVREVYEDRGVDWTEHTLVTTGESGNLRDLADEHDLPVLPVPDGVPGRFSALSTVGLASAAILGVDVESVVTGARAERESLSGSLYETPAYAYGAITYALNARGASANVVMPYHESLETYAEWYAQLSAESLGKAGLGQTPVRALGATDQHSQLQLYRAGPNDKLVTFVHARDGPDVDIPDAELEGLDYLDGASLGELRDAEFEATEASLADVGLPNVRVEIERVDAAAIGGLLYGMEAATVLAGELYGVETFTQPAVEWGKEVARDLLRGGDPLDETTSLRVTRE
ncbi:glucose-6-phosphate isomerase [Halarchaeum nitratireducens]|uniref:Probable glucose-6-phosphate isomerase n=1 Tax=Halarchaeum nitratireducens TaxID=489913 RepID=A0A830G7M1_9EURY|nr:glucose-6-phosphate isomerase [Halarchaeum nitratireducens]GGN06874.1 glucose-6-phosphate isomerase [Halarchaeum nitratireducens]